MAILVLAISIILDGILNNTLPFINLSLFTPLLTLISVISIYPLYKKETKEYLLTIFIVGIIYDLLYTNLLFYNGVLFIVIGLFNIYLNKKIQVNYLTELLILIMNIVVYILLNSLIILICNLTIISIDKIVYVILHSLIINIVYGYILFFIIKRISSKNKKLKLN